MFPKHQAGDEFQSETFKNITAAAGVFEDLRFLDCTFNKCNFPESFFRGCKFLNCTFKNCNLDLIHIPATSFNGVRFEKTHCAGVDWTEAHWERLPWPGAIQFYHSSVNHNTFMGLKLPRLVLNHCIAIEANFEECDLTGSDLRSTDFSGCRFHHTNLSGADLTRSVNYVIPPQYNQFKGTRFNLPEALSLLHALDIQLVDTTESEEGELNDGPH
jgi:uncharacterized protein YjbI with pentapeptide repeats